MYQPLCGSFNLQTTKTGFYFNKGGCSIVFDWIKIFAAYLLFFSSISVVAVSLKLTCGSLASLSINVNHLYMLHAVIPGPFVFYECHEINSLKLFIEGKWFMSTPE